MDTLPEGTEVDPLGELIKGAFAGERNDLDTEFRFEHRGLSTVDRIVEKHSNFCKLCAANDDPANVPVHPGCHCDIKTMGVETGVAEHGHQMLGVITKDRGNFIMPAIDMLVPDGVLFDPSSVAILDPENMRYGDILAWLDQMDTLLDKADYVAVAIQDGQDQIDQLGNVLELGSDVLSKRTWLAIAKGVVL